MLRTHTPLNLRPRALATFARGGRVTLLADLQIFHQNVMEAHTGGCNARESEERGGSSSNEAHRGIKNKTIGTKNLGRAEVPLMTHSDDNMWGSLMLEENWPRVSDSSVPGAQPVSYLTQLKSSQSSYYGLSIAIGLYVRHRHEISNRFTAF